MFNKELFLMSLKDDFRKSMKPLSKNAIPILGGLSIASMLLGTYFMWKDVPSAKEAIEKKKEIDPGLSRLEAMAVAAPHLVRSGLAYSVAGGCIVATVMVSEARIASATSLAVAAVAEKNRVVKKFEQITNKETVAQAKKELFEEAHPGVQLADDDDDGDPTTFGTDQAKKNQMRENDLRLNKLVRCVFDDKRETWTSLAALEAVEPYILKTYGKGQNGRLYPLPFSLNDMTKLINVDYGDYGDRVGFSDADRFHLHKVPAYDSRTGEMFMLVSWPDPSPDFQLPWTK